MLALNYMKLAEESKYHAGMVGAYMARAAGSGASSDRLKQQLNIAATGKVDTAWQKYLDGLNSVKRGKVTEADRLAFFRKNLPIQIAMMQGEIPDEDSGPELFEKPGGPILKRP